MKDKSMYPWSHLTCLLLCFCRLCSKSCDLMIIDSQCALSFRLGSAFWSWQACMSAVLFSPTGQAVSLSRTSPESEVLDCFEWPWPCIVVFRAPRQFPTFSNSFFKIPKGLIFPTAVGDICLGSGKFALFMCRKSLWTTHFNRFQQSTKRCYIHLENRTDFLCFAVTRGAFWDFPRNQHCSHSWPPCDLGDLKSDLLIGEGFPSASGCVVSGTVCALPCWSGGAWAGIVVPAPSSMPGITPSRQQFHKYS